MTTSNRRDFMRIVASATGAGIGVMVFPPAIARALAIAPHRCKGTLEDVEHIVILMQENRSFDHYFGTLRGVRGFGDRFPIPVPDSPGIVGKTVWYQPNATAGAEPAVVTPFRLNTAQTFEYMRVEGTPHGWTDSQYAWNDGKLDAWPRSKLNHSLGYFEQQDIPFQFALAEAFTLCDGYHCSIQSSTNPNRLLLWTGTNDGLAAGGGPAIDNRYDNVEFEPTGGYTWVTYCERLEDAGISWQVYQNMADNFTDDSVAGFKTFRDAFNGVAGARAELAARGLSTRDLDLLKQDVLGGTLPSVSWIVATAEGSEHPGPSSPAQGADYTARVLDALTANPDVWSKTVLIVNFDENDGFFDHVPPPAVPSYTDATRSVLAGDSTVDTSGEYHEVLAPDTTPEAALLQFQPYGLGPRVPLYVVSPWSKGGWVNSQVGDHTSVIRLIEARFGVYEPNISPWRRAVCSDLTSCFDFAAPDDTELDEPLPDTTEAAERARALPGRTTPPTPAPVLPVQATGVRPSRALPYELHVHADVHPRAQRVALSFENTGRVAACFHVYDRRHLERVPRRYTVEAGKSLVGSWELAADDGAYDLWVLGPSGFHRHFTGAAEAAAAEAEVRVCYDARGGNVSVRLRNDGAEPRTFALSANAYFGDARESVTVAAGDEKEHRWSLASSSHWYDFTVRAAGLDGWSRRFAGRVETGRPSFSDPAQGGRARGER